MYVSRFNSVLTHFENSDWNKRSKNSSGLQPRRHRPESTVNVVIFFPYLHPPRNYYCQKCRGCKGHGRLRNIYHYGMECSTFLSNAMSSVLRAQRANAARAETSKRKPKRKADSMDVDDDEPLVQPRKRNKQRVLLLSSRGVTHRMRHLMSDLEALLPHTKKGMSSCQIMPLD